MEVTNPISPVSDTNLFNKSRFLSSLQKNNGLFPKGMSYGFYPKLSKPYCRGDYTHDNLSDQLDFIVVVIHTIKCLKNVLDEKYLIV